MNERLHISFFGRRNAGKSSLVNRVTGQNLSVVSDVAGTTTDPVQKTMELLPLGPVLIIDTPGYDDEGILGEMRVERTNEILRKTDVAILVVDAQIGKTDMDQGYIQLFQQKNVPYLVVYNKADLADVPPNEIAVSALNNQGIEQLKNKIGALQAEPTPKYIIADKLNPNSKVILVCPIDEAAPKGRLILPQQNTIRELLDFGHTALVCQPEQLQCTLDSLRDAPDLVICDSQVFGFCAKTLPANVKLTSFSILMARYKGVLDYAVQGATSIEKVPRNAKIIISEGCTHHRQCGDIGTVKIPNLIRKHTGKDFQFEFTSGGTFPSDLSEYALVIHCGGCMLNEREMQARLDFAKQQNIPMTNYGILLAYLNGILSRSLEILY